MKTDHRLRRWLLSVLTILAISSLPLMAAEKPEIIAKIEALNKPENLVGSWKSIEAPAKLAGGALTLSFTENGEFEMTLTKKNGGVTVEKGSYTLPGQGWPLKVRAVSGEKTHYLAITVMPNDQIVMDELKSFDDADAEGAFKDAVKLVRQNAAPGISASEKSETGALQKRENLIGAWKHPALKVSMSFSEGGEYELRNEKEDTPRVVKGSYTVTSSGDSLVVHVTFNGGEDYYAIRLLSMDRFAWQQLKTPEEAPDPEKTVVWLRKR